MPPAIIDTMTDFRASILRQEAAQMQRLAASWLDIERTLLDSMEALAADIQQRQSAGEAVSEWRIRRLERYQELLRQVRIQLLQFGEGAEREIVQAQRVLAELGLEHSQTLIRMAAGSVDVGFDHLNVDAVQNMVGAAGDGSPLNALLREAYGDGMERMTQELVRSTALGRNPRETARRMMQGNREGLNRTLNIARTEQLRVYREASRAQYEASGVVASFRRLSAKDSRTCPACLMADGELYEVREQLREHPQGRCAIVPVVEGAPPIRWQLGRDWFRQQDAATQRSILGPGKYDAWQAGKFDLDQLVSVRRNDTWGDSVQVTPLQELIGD